MFARVRWDCTYSEVEAICAIRDRDADGLLTIGQFAPC